jgi:hypothetical protein
MLHALEVTDLDRRGRRTTARFFDGSKPEYPRPMRCVQGSDAHRATRDPRNGKNPGIGERITEVLLPELTYEALYEVFSGNDFARTRPYRGTTTTPYDHVLGARQEGVSLVQDFHESMAKRGGLLYGIISDICAFSNTNGGTLYIGVSANPKVKPIGVTNISQAVEQLTAEIHKRITPPVKVSIDTLKTEGVPIISLAVRDEIVQLVARIAQGDQPPPEPERKPVVEEPPAPKPERAAPPPGTIDSPRTGVEVIGTEKRGDTYYHHVRDLRNGNIVRNVTRKSARKLWHYAITQVEDKSVDVRKLSWHGDIALIQRYTRAGKTRYDLAQRTNGRTRIYYGVTEDGVQDSAHSAWREILDLEDDD